MIGISGWIRQVSIGYQHLTDPARGHARQGLFETLDHLSTAQYDTIVINIFIKGPALWSSLGLKRPTCDGEKREAKPKNDQKGKMR